MLKKATRWLMRMRIHSKKGWKKKMIDKVGLLGNIFSL